MIRNGDAPSTGKSVIIGVPDVSATTNVMPGQVLGVEDTELHFMTASIVHDNPYPCDLNCLTVTVAVNVMLRRGESSITIKGLNGASFPLGTSSGTQKIMVNSTTPTGRDHLFFSYSATDSEPGTGLFINRASPELVLHMAADAGCGESFAIKFCVYNPQKFQSVSSPGPRPCPSPQPQALT